MKHRICSIALLLALLLSLAIPAAAYEIPTDFTNRTIEDLMEEFMQAHGLNESNFSISYYNTVTGERYAYNDEAFMLAGSTYKLPLNMYYYEMEREGVFAPDVYISRVQNTLDVAHYETLVNSDNDMAIGMLYNLGEFQDYKKLMLKYFTMEDHEIDPIYYADNYYCTRMMMDALQYLYEYRADFEEMIGYMKQAQPGAYFRAGVTHHEVAHKYGLFEGAINDVGIIFAHEPFLLAVYTQDSNELVVSGVAKLLTAYHDWNWAAQQAQEEEERAEGMELEIQEVTPEEPEEEILPQEPEEETPPEPLPEEPQPKEAAFEWWMVVIALGIFLVGGGLVLMLVKPERLKEKYGDSSDSEDG